LPSILSPRDIARLAAVLRDKFQLDRAAAFAIEIDPRALADKTIL